MLAISKPAVYTLELTPACNNHCPGCSNSYATRSPGGCLSLPEWEALLQQVGPDAARIRLTGGEPSLHPDFFRILEAAASFSAAVSVFTNGRWSKPNLFVQQIRRHPRVAGLLVSLHGANAQSHEKFNQTPGSFAQTVKNIKLALDHGVNIALSVVLHQYNLDEIEAITSQWLEWGVEHIAFNRFIGSPNSDYALNAHQMRQAIAMIDRLAEQGAPVEHSVCIPQCFLSNTSEQCLAGVASICIDPWGRLRPCLYSQTILGSLKENALDELWKGAALAQWRSNVPEGCQGCIKSETCFGGCRAVGEYQPAACDSLISQPVIANQDFIVELPESLRPLPAFDIRPEPFGYALLSSNKLLFVSPESLKVIEACDGRNTFANLFERFSEPELALLGELWQGGFLRYVEED